MSVRLPVSKNVRGPALGSLLLQVGIAAVRFLLGITVLLSRFLAELEGRTPSETTQTKDKPAVESTERSFSYDDLPLALARLAEGDSDRCQAVLGDGTRCPLQLAAEGWTRWCAPHAERKRLWHDEILASKKHAGFERWVDGWAHHNAGNAANDRVFNQLQAILALRILITAELYAGNEDDGHRQARVSLRSKRDELNVTLARNHSDRSGMLSVRHYVDEFLAEADERERRLGVMINLIDAATVEDPPTVSQLFSAPGSSALRDEIDAKVDRNRNLRPFPELIKYWDPSEPVKEYTPEELDEMSREGWDKPMEEVTAAIDEETRRWMEYQAEQMLAAEEWEWM